MHLSRVEIEGFRCFSSFAIDLAPGLNVLAGRNNIGKTNLLAAIRLALGPAAARGESPWLTRDDFHRPSVGSAPVSTIKITLTFESLTESERAHFFEVVDFHLDHLAESTAVLNFEASWAKGQRQPKIDRWGGPPGADRAPVPPELLASIPITFLPALRDAEAALAPGARSRLALLLRDRIDREGPEVGEEIKQIFAAANEQLERQPLVRGVQEELQGTTQQLAGSDYSASAIRAAELETDRILRTLRVQMAGQPIGDLALSGLGYNNLLYIAVVLEHLRNPGVDECPILLVEEPEAHLHPQLTLLLAQYLAGVVPAEARPQTVVTTHSPVLASSVQPRHIVVMTARRPAEPVHACPFRLLGLEDAEERRLHRMMDVTRATLYFAKGLILVEGISEALLIPVLARRLDQDLAKRHISVLPICGVSFRTFAKLFGLNGLGIPVAIVSDADPPTEGKGWENELPARQADGGLAVGDRAKGLAELFAGQGAARAFFSQVTLEFDLAEAGVQNAGLMASAWESCFAARPKTFSADRLAAAGATTFDRAICAWRGICRASHSGSKAEFAQALALLLEQEDESGSWQHQFAAPEYLRAAIDHVCGQEQMGERSQGANPAAAPAGDRPE